MASCDFCDRCFFFNEPLVDNLLSNAEYLRERYCARNFTECAIYKLAKTCGFEHVRGCLFPDDILNTNLPEVSQLQEEKENLIKVIFADGYSGEVWASSLGRFIRKGSIAAYLSVEEWVELRRKRSNVKYPGPERRRCNSVSFKSLG